MRNYRHYRTLFAALPLLTAACTLLSPLPPGPVAVVISAASGRVLVTSEEKYVVGEKDMAVRIDERVITLDNAQAELTYYAIDEAGNATGPSCTVEIPADSQLVISGTHDCRGGKVLSNSSEQVSEQLSNNGS